MVQYSITTQTTLQCRMAVHNYLRHLDSSARVMVSSEQPSPCQLSRFPRPHPGSPPPRFRHRAFRSPTSSDGIRPAPLSRPSNPDSCLSPIYSFDVAQPGQSGRRRGAGVLASRPTPSPHPTTIVTQLSTMNFCGIHSWEYSCFLAVPFLSPLGFSEGILSFYSRPWRSLSLIRTTASDDTSTSPTGRASLSSINNRSLIIIITSVVKLLKEK